MMGWNSKKTLAFKITTTHNIGAHTITCEQQEELISLCVLRPARAPTASASTDGPTSRARWWSSAMTVIQCRIVSTATTSTPATWWTATGPSTSTPITVGASILWGLGSTASSVTGGPPVLPLGPSAESLIFSQSLYTLLIVATGHV